MRRAAILSWLYVLSLCGFLAFSLFSARMNPMDDHFFYQRFIETLAEGRFDLSIPGFHGMNILAVPWYLLTRSPTAQIEFQMFSGAILPLLGYLSGCALFRRRSEGLLLASILAMMPFLSFSSLRGWMVATYIALVLLTIIGAARGAWWTGVTWGFALTSLPFAVALAPLLLLLSPGRGWTFRRIRPLVVGVLIAATYVVVQFLQTGHVNIGVHQGMGVLSVWSGPRRIFLNAAHALQILFSVHNYYFIDPARTGHGNMMQTTPILIFLGLFALLRPRDFFRDMRFPFVLFLCSTMGLGLSLLLDHMDHFYMETGILFLIFAALPLVRSEPLWLPLVLSTLHFQWLYFFLQHHAVFGLDWRFFLVPLFVDVSFMVWLLWHWKAIYAMFQRARLVLLSFLRG